MNTLLEPPSATRTANAQTSLSLALAASWALILCSVFALAYVYGEHPAYIWDSRSYWEKYFTFGATLHHSTHRFISALTEDIWANDSNALPSVILLPFYALFGASRGAYITAIVACYLVPACLLSALVSCQAVGAHASVRWHRWVIAFFALALLCPQFWAPSLLGLPDMIGAMPILLFAASYMRHDVNKPMAIRTLVYWGLLLWLPFLFRRWYAYTVVSLVISTTLFGIFEFYRARTLAKPAEVRTAWRALPWSLIRNLSIVGIVSGLCVIGAQGGFVDHILHTHYADIYSAYQLLDWREHFTRFYYHFGPFSIGAALIGAWLGLRREHTRRITFFVLANIALTFKLFTTTQAFTVQHYVPIAAWLLLLQAVALWSVWHMLARHHIIRLLLAGMYGALTVAYFCNILVRPVPGFSGLLTTDHYYQRRLDHYPEYTRLTRDLEALLADDKKVAVFSSNGYLCDSLLQSLSFEQLSPHIHFASQVDKRDLFDTESIMTDYVVVADPIQLHLRPSDQQVISVPANFILNHDGIGAAYERLPEHYVLDHGAVASIYRKTRPFHEAEVKRLFDELFRTYPEWRPLYDEAKLQYLTQHVVMGDKAVAGT